MKLRKIKKLAILATTSIIFLSCQTQPIEVTQLYWDGVKCFERPYRYAPDFIGPIGASIEVPSEYCFEMVGYSFDEYQDVTAYAEESRLRCLDNSIK